MEIDELKMLSLYLPKTWRENFDPLPSAIADRTHWQYDSGSHSSYSRRMYGSVITSALLNDGTEISVRRVGITGSSQRPICTIITSK